MNPPAPTGIRPQPVKGRVERKVPHIDGGRHVNPFFKYDEEAIRLADHGQERELARREIEFVRSSHPRSVDGVDRPKWNIVELRRELEKWGLA